jgi:hypothetical protein
LEGKKNPKSLQDGYVHDILHVNTDDMEIKIGSGVFKKSEVGINAHGKPIFWFEPPLLKGEPSKLCAIFYNDDGSVISYINRNQFTALSTNQDIKSTATKLVIKSNNQVCLVMDREGDKVLHISKMKFKYLNVSIALENENRFILKQNGFEMNLENFIVENVTFNFGGIPAMRVSNPLELAIILEISSSVVKIKNLENETVGWHFNSGIFNKKYDLVGYVLDGNVYNIMYEFIGRLVGSYVLHNDECYETGEPIYISKENRIFFKNQSGLGYDVSFRLFPFVID